MLTSPLVSFLQKILTLLRNGFGKSSARYPTSKRHPVASALLAVFFYKIKHLRKHFFLMLSVPSQNLIFQISRILLAHLPLTNFTEVMYNLTFKSKNYKSLPKFLRWHGFKRKPFLNKNSQCNIFVTIVTFNGIGIIFTQLCYNCSLGNFLFKT